MFWKTSSDVNLVNIFAFFGIVVGILYILFVGSSLFIPFIIAVLFAFAIIGLANVFKGFKIPSFIAFCLSILVYVLCFGLIWKLIGSSVNDFVALLPNYQGKVLGIISHTFSLLHLKEPPSVVAIFQKLDFQSLFTSFLWAITSIFSNAGVVFFYMIFILLEYRFFKIKLNLMMVDAGKKKIFFEIIERIKKDVWSYFFIKTAVWMLWGILSFLVMKIFHLDFALFLGFTFFVLHYIPNVGFIIAVVLTFVLSLVHFESYSTSLILFAFLQGIELITGSLIEPQFMGNRLNLSPLVLIISLVFWGTMWWIVWMLLAMPIMVIMNIIFAQIPSTRSIAILLSEKGEIEIDSDEKVDKNRKRILKRFTDTFKK